MHLSDHTGMVQIAPNGWANAAGAQEYERLKAYYHRHPYPAEACEQGPTWKCPYWPNPVCFERNGRSMTKFKAERSVVIVWSYRVPVLVPVGQMDLFNPHITRKTVWRHPKPYRRDQEGPTPWPDGVCHCCKDKAVEMVLYLQKIEPEATYWRVIPQTESLGWLHQQQDRMDGRIKPCVFDVI